MTSQEFRKIVLAGEGGQGVQLAGELLAEAAYVSGLESVYIPNFGVEQRGGVSVAFVQVSPEKIGAPKFQKADVLVVLSPRSISRTKDFIRPGTIYIYDSSTIQPPEINDRAVGIQGYDTVAPEAFTAMVGNENHPPMDPPAFGEIRPIPIPAAEIAKQELNPRVFNIIILGVVAGLMEFIPRNAFQEALHRKLGNKFKERPELEELNLRALEKGREYANRFASSLVR